MPRISALILAVALLAGGLLCPAAAMAQSREEAIRLYNEADKLDANPQSNEDLVKAAQKYEQALKIFEKLGDKKRVGMCANNVGLIYAGWGQYDKAKEYLDRAMALDPNFEEGKRLRELF